MPTVKRPEMPQHTHTHPQQQQHNEIYYDGTSKRICKDLPQTTIAPAPLPAFTHLQTSAINRTIDRVNEIIMILFKQKVKADEGRLVSLLKFFNAPIPRANGAQIDLVEAKRPEFLCQLNICILQKLFRDLNSENDKNVPEQKSASFRFFVGFGNNHPIVA